MNTFLTIISLILFLSITQVVTAQRVTCSCAASDKSCNVSVTCPNGCTAVCAPKDICYVSCRNDVLYPRVSIKLVKKNGEEIASILSAKTDKRVEFIPYPRKARERYNIELKDDDIWNTLNFLSQRGTVKIGGVDFETFKALRRERGVGEKFR